VNILERLFQFVCIYSCALLLLWTIKFIYGLSDYLIPSPGELVRIVHSDWVIYTRAVLNTLAVAIAGHILAVSMAAVIGLLGRTDSRIGHLTRTAAYNLQAYPIVAVAPIIFIFLGNGLASRLLISAMICYFPLLLSFLGIFSQPVEEVEHFFRVSGRINWKLEIAVRTFENLDKLKTVIVGSGTLAMVGTIVAEFLAATNGIGYMIRKALYQNNLARILFSLFLIGLCSSVYLSLIETLGNWTRRKLTGNGHEAGHEPELQ